MKLFATFRRGREKIQTFDLPEETTCEEILRLLNIDPKEVSIYLINGKASELNRKLVDEDILSIFPPVGGG